jgi:diaminohydroxyphosphoribosylaminopyrimidine deaminase / 5-amino-6-(5-phosphoribosylamino)uracil reductase
MAGSAKLVDQLKIDHQFMAIALNMARRGLGTTAPNPSVGAVIVDTAGIILGRGWTQPGGRPHAEVVALERAGEAARGATLYVTLEPCSHTGQSPPCADAVIKAGIKRVVCGIHDPNRLVAGQGFAKLHEAGIEVVENVMASKTHWLTLGHILKVSANRPFVQLKIATGSDGLIARGDGEPVWVTGAQARAKGHLLRARSDAILVGIGTVLTDDPSLDCRLPGLEANSPAIIVLDNLCRLPLSAKLVEGGRLHRLVTTVHFDDADDLSQERIRAEKLIEAGIKIWAAPTFDTVPLAILLADLADDGITRLLVEGGPRIWRSFLDNGLVDEIVHFRGSKPAGNSGLLPFVDEGLEWLERNHNFEMVDQRSVGEDKMMVYRNKQSMKAV